MAKQPWYHRVDGVLFTGTGDITQEDFEKALEKALVALKAGYVKGSLQIEEWAEPEPGDPADL